MLRINNWAGQLNISIISLMLLLIGCSQSYSLGIENISQEEITIEEAHVNGKLISTRKMYLEPHPKGYIQVNHYAEFKVRKLNSVSIRFKKANNTDVALNCTVEDIKGAGCLLRVGYYGSSQLGCVCDSYADFDD